MDLLTNRSAYLPLTAPVVPGEFGISLDLGPYLPIVCVYFVQRNARIAQVEVTAKGYTRCSVLKTSLELARYLCTLRLAACNGPYVDFHA